MSLLQVRELAVDFLTSTRIIHAVRGIGFDIAAGERVGLVGESGSGKTTAALALMRMIRPPGRIVAGMAHLDGTDLLALGPEEMRQARLKRVSYVPQGAMNALNPVLRIGDQILDGVIDHDVVLARGERLALVASVLSSVGLPVGVADLFPHELSGGMKQRACIAIAMALKPRLIIADEPTSALDVLNQRQVMNTLCRVQEEMGCGLIMIGHDMGLMAQVAGRIIVMRDGVIVEDAPARELFQRPRHAYSRMLIESVPTLGNRAEGAGRAADVATSERAPLLAFEAVGKVFGSGLFGRARTTALQPCSFRLASDHAQIIAVVGQSGSGKTTMARMILGLEKPSCGQVRYRGELLGALAGAAAQRYRREVQAIFQDPYGSFNPFYKIDHTLAAPLVRFGIASGRKAVHARIEEACAAVGLRASEMLGRFPHELSGGQRQRLMVARALLLRPRLIVADEPVSMVDASLRMTILQNIETLKNDHCISIVYITHDLATAYHISDYVLVLHEGRIVEAGPPEDVIQAPIHPYTQALVSAIPWPDPRRKWPDLPASMGEQWQAPPVVRGRVPGFELEAA
jgi:peptide/nickel transport system ATP-binding protein